MNYNVFNQNQLNVGVSAWEPGVTLAAKSNDSALPRLGQLCGPCGSHLHFTVFPPSPPAPTPLQQWELCPAQVTCSFSSVLLT